LKILPGNSVPQTVFKREDFHLLLLNTKNLSVWKLNNDLLRPKIDREVLLQIKAGFGIECAMQFHALRAANPGMEQFVFDFDAPRQDDQLAYGRGLFHIHAVVDGDARLQMGDVDKSSA